MTSPTDDRSRVPYGPPATGPAPGPPDAPRSWVGSRPVTAIRVLTAIGALLVGGWGLYWWPDAPVRPTTDGYASKTGRRVSREEYDRFVVWERALPEASAAKK